jgi:hypothetical protein
VLRGKCLAHFTCLFIHIVLVSQQELGHSFSSAFDLIKVINFAKGSSGRTLLFRLLFCLLLLLRLVCIRLFFLRFRRVAQVFGWHSKSVEWVKALSRGSNVGQVMVMVV